jgi:protein-tyrosine phosphatase
MAERLLERIVTSALTNPLAMAVKAKVADAWWRLRGRTLRNPPLAGMPRSVLFVCKGNICRSPFAGYLAAALFERAGEPGVRCESAGFIASVDDSSPRAAVAAAAEFGVSLHVHKPTPLTAAMVERADLVVAMEAAHFLELRHRYPKSRDRVLLLPLYAPVSSVGRGYRRFNIADPYGKPREVFSDCYSHINTALHGLVSALQDRRTALDASRSAFPPERDGRRAGPS